MRYAAVFDPTWPRPMMPTVRPASSRPMNASRSLMPPARIAMCVSGMRFSSASIIPSACSATPSALPPAWFTTAMPARVQASTSTVSYPAPYVTARSRDGIFAIRSSVTWNGNGSSLRAEET
ncbi:MAG: hypothetical protein O2822_00730 [Chloroflexi bacterium]|nr:hypothetical protein [Chloroflexota bacterium]